MKRPKQEKLFYKKWWFWAAIIIVLALGSYGIQGNNTNTANSTNPVLAKQTEPTKEADLSDVHLKVLSIESKDSVGNNYELTNKKAQGIFKIIKLSIENNRQDDIFVDACNFKLLDSGKREFIQNADARTIYGIFTGYSDFILAAVKPGETVEGFLIYDVPKEAHGFVLQGTGGMFGQNVVLLKVE